MLVPARAVRSLVVAAKHLADLDALRHGRPEAATGRVRDHLHV
jgi:hypothetical protein